VRKEKKYFSFPNYAIIIRLYLAGAFVKHLTYERQTIPVLEWNAPTKIKLIRELTFSLASNILQMLMQKLLKSMINWFRPMFAMVKGIRNCNLIRELIVD